MDNFDLNVPGSQGHPESVPFDDKPIPFDDSPIPFDNGSASKSGVSQPPLDLNNESASASKMPTIEPPKTIQKSTAKIVSCERITGVKTFFTKLHAGSIDFLNEQINKWLKENPGVVIKRTDTVTGMVAAKKTEPNLIITVWY